MKLKLIVAALALVAAGSANAAIDNGATSGNGSLFLVVTDTTAGISFVGDLGTNMDGFLAASNSNQSWNLAGYTAWNTFVTDIGGSLVNAKYAVYAEDNFGSYVAGSQNVRRLLTTSGVADDVSGYVTSNSKLGNVTLSSSLVNTWLTAVQADANSLMNDHDTVADGSSYTNKTAGYAQGKIGDKLANNMPFVTTVAANEAASFWLLGNNGTGTTTQVNLAQQAGTFNLAGDTLAYAVAAPVPEADSYALMLAGMGLVGFLARRRKA